MMNTAVVLNQLVPLDMSVSPVPLMHTALEPHLPVLMNVVLLALSMLTVLDPISTVSLEAVLLVLRMVTVLVMVALSVMDGNVSLLVLLSCRLLSCCWHSFMLLFFKL